MSFEIQVLKIINVWITKYVWIIGNMLTISQTPKDMSCTQNMSHWIPSKYHTFQITFR